MSVRTRRCTILPKSRNSPHLVGCSRRGWMVAAPPSAARGGLPVGRGGLSHHRRLGKARHGLPPSLPAQRSPWGALRGMRGALGADLENGPTSVTSVTEARVPVSAVRCGGTYIRYKKKVTTHSDDPSFVSRAHSTCVTVSHLISPDTGRAMRNTLPYELCHDDVTSY